ncbi:hypothetical protein BDY24DRAFT_395545 [Mrakia frigida]|uniref:zinc finger MYND domain-containing protein n=1 Tax=Mrakia frigida TaxID=29902 RepID=UPI003FCC0239
MSRGYRTKCSPLEAPESDREPSSVSSELSIYLDSLRPTPTIYNLCPPQSGVPLDGYHAAASPEAQILRRGLEKLIRERDQHFAGSRPEWFAPGNGLRSRLKLVETLLRLDPGDEEKKVAMNFIWSRCSGEVEGEQCEGNGGTMMMCGKCGVERYCGKAHQKAQWKTHKFECVAPAW